MRVPSDSKRHRAVARIMAGALSAFCAGLCSATPFLFSTGNPDGKLGTASRPGSAGTFEIASADDFVLTEATSLSSATFTGLIPSGSSVQSVIVGIYRVFPSDSDVSRTTGAPTFSTPQVPTRVNSPSDVAFDDRDSAGGSLSFSTSVVAASFSVLNSVLPGGIHAIPNQTTGGGGLVTGSEVRFDINFTTALLLPASHYYFVPQVELDNGAFLWLSAPRPIVAPGTPFPAGMTDLQSWTRDAYLDPDWLRIGTDIIGGAATPTFNLAFSLNGMSAVPEPDTLLLLSISLAGLGWSRRRPGGLRRR